ncbi:MAG: hypothetical protein RL701_5371 [Pseudomonadota bacterium]|jgi:dihydropteroate synthase
MQRCQVWAVLNVTPDSFSDGGQYLDPNAAFVRAKELLAHGADVLDIGGVSTRPRGQTYGGGATPVSLDEELHRVVPVIERVVGELGAKVSIDTTRAEVARAALRAGARIVNDVSNGASEALLEIVAEADAELILMHNRGDGSVEGGNASYADVQDDVIAELSAAAMRARSVGVATAHIWLDPGIGFAKTAADSVAVLADIPRLLGTGYRVLIGASRKSFISAIEARAQLHPSAPLDRLGGTAAAVTWSVLSGAHAVRVHDLPAMRQAILVTEALLQARADRAAKDRLA